ncbi:hypothetical protein IWQ60_011946 [Tieghemiomyces parasiticus]|uniref:RBR-type E3 ubiquitin transferase n=1 Tax=Tieghemiomyces parasiticus TaxID=78921 RepID=A0A9W7ZG64_9FUNG|nr:hypothetical protein IWQ60_011946 [Tieghemiomyces parasiticus]
MSSIYEQGFHYERGSCLPGNLAEPPKDTVYWGSATVSVELLEPEVTVMVQDGTRTIQLTALPPLVLYFALPSTYPVGEPSLAVRCSWLTAKQTDQLRIILRELCQEQPAGSPVLDLLVDTLRHQSFSHLDLAFPLALSESIVTTPIRRLAVDFDRQLYPEFPTLAEELTTFAYLEAFARALDERQFARGRYPCGICFDTKPGTVCYRFPTCDHVYCHGCIRGYFTMLVSESLLAELRCPHPSCRPRADRLDDDHLRELLDASDFAKFIRLREEQLCQVDPNSRWCPQVYCRRRVTRTDPNERLAVCPHCQFAFCFLCGRTWHGPRTYCPMPNDQKVAELYLACRTEDERVGLERRYGKKSILVSVQRYEEFRATADWLATHATQCPTCDTPIQKSHGCNHMKCHFCQTHFCFLCGSFVPKDNPYSHFNMRNSSCHMRLFEGITGDTEGEADRADFAADEEEALMLLQAAQLT